MSSSNKKIRKYILGMTGKFKYIYVGKQDSSISTLLNKKGCVQLEEIGQDSLSKKYFCKEYVDAVGKLGLRYNSSYWWVTFAASKNRFSSKLADKLFFIYSTTAKIKRHEDDNILIIVSDKTLFSGFKEYLKDYNAEFVEIKDTLNQFILTIKEALKILISLALFIFRTWKEIYLSRYYLNGSLKAEIKNKAYYVIKTFIYDRSFNEDNDYHDLFFGRLPEYLKDKKKVLILGDILGDYRQCLNKIRKNNSFLIISPEYLISYIDPLKSVLRTLINRVVIRKKIRFLEFNISDIINSEITADYKKGSPFRQYLYYIFMERLLKLIKI